MRNRPIEPTDIMHACAPAARQKHAQLKQDAVCGAAGAG
jgi:hypothetical protein